MYTSVIVLAATALLANAAPLTHVVRTVDSQPSYWNTSGLLNSTTTAPSPTGTAVLTTASPSVVSSGSPSVVSSGSPSVVPSGSPSLPVPVAVVFPDFTSQYHAASGAVDFHTPRGYVSRNPKNGGDDSSALVTFQLDKKYANKECQLVFDLEDPSSKASGSKKVQLFSSLAPATASSESWPSGNLRNEYLGNVNVAKGGRASWEANSGPGASKNGIFPCSNIAGMVYGAEIVPQGDEVELSWPAGKDGFKILVW